MKASRILAFSIILSVLIFLALFSLTISSLNSGAGQNAPPSDPVMPLRTNVSFVGADLTDSLEYGLMHKIMLRFDRNALYNFAIYDAQGDEGRQAGIAAGLDEAGFMIINPIGEVPPSDNVIDVSGGGVGYSATEEAAILSNYFEKEGVTSIAVLCREGDGLKAAKATVGAVSEVSGAVGEETLKLLMNKGACVLWSGEADARTAALLRSSGYDGLIAAVSSDERMLSLLEDGVLDCVVYEDYDALADVAAAMIKGGEIVELAPRLITKD